jgi:hypothetical protein
MNSVAGVEYDYDELYYQLYNCTDTTYNLSIMKSELDRPCTWLGWVIRSGDVHLFANFYVDY